jgi:hypothetical protein
MPTMTDQPRGPDQAWPAPSTRSRKADRSDAEELLEGVLLAAQPSPEARNAGGHLDAMNHDLEQFFESPQIRWPESPTRCRLWARMRCSRKGCRLVEVEVRRANLGDFGRRCR